MLPACGRPARCASRWRRLHPVPPGRPSRRRSTVPVSERRVSRTPESGLVGPGPRFSPSASRPRGSWVPAQGCDGSVLGAVLCGCRCVPTLLSLNV